MFTDSRSKRVILVAHCVLNQNAISDGTADFPGTNEEVVRALLDAKAGIVQMPCPELCCLGLDRGNILGAESPIVVENTRIRRGMQKNDAAAKLAVLADHVAGQIIEYQKHGFEVLGIVGINRSPCCGVDTTSDDDKEIRGEGVFIANLRTRLEEAGVTIPIIGIKASEDAAQRVKKLL